VDALQSQLLASVSVTRSLVEGWLPPPPSSTATTATAEDILREMARPARYLFIYLS
jgi:hypothetical protein